jgi:hypothetical protein
MAPNMMLLLVHHVSYQWLVLNVVYTWEDLLQKMFVRNVGTPEMSDKLDRLIT